MIFEKNRSSSGQKNTPGRIVAGPVGGGAYILPCHKAFTSLASPRARFLAFDAAAPGLEKIKIKLLADGKPIFIL
jgi:hypothetical protein